MEARIRIAVLAAKGTEVFTDLCAQFGISRKTGYKWLNRYRALGIAGTREWSRRPERCPHRTAAKVEAALLRARRAHRSWGPKKLRELLRREPGVDPPPSIATLARILQRHGVAGKRGWRRRHGAILRGGPRPLTRPEAPNQVWTADYKGWFRLGDGQRCIRSRSPICTAVTCCACAPCGRPPRPARGGY